MSSMTDALTPDQMVQHNSMQFTMTAPTVRIRRTGARPLVFEGIELAMAMSFTPALPYWYEINLYRTNEQHFAVAIRLFYQSASEQDHVRAWECDSLDQALDKIANYDAAQDVRFAIDPAASNLAAAELAAMAMELRARIMSARAHFASLVGEFFYELDMVKVPVPRGRA